VGFSAAADPPRTAPDKVFRGGSNWILPSAHRKERYFEQRDAEGVMFFLPRVDGFGFLILFLELFLAGLEYLLVGEVVVQQLVD
jgi:hypothetical protein